MKDSVNITFLGTCSGTQPVPGFRHVSFVIEHKENVYWFDAGEGCSYTAHLLGINLLATRSIFITHTHMDHIGGLANLLWNIRKLHYKMPAKPKRPLSGKTIPVFIPNINTWKGIQQILAGTEGDYHVDFTLEGKSFREGVIFDQNQFSVTAMPNKHLGIPKDKDTGLSFSFLIRAGEKTIVYSGDLRDIREIEPLLKKKTDLLLMETGHHKVEDVCRFVKKHKEKVGLLGFIHHGSAILDNMEADELKARNIIGDRVLMTRDEMTLSL